MLLRALLWRPLRRHPFRFVMTVLGVAAGVASVIATISSSRAAVASLREGVEEVAGRARLEVSRPGGVDENLLGRLRDLSHDAVIVPVIEELTLLPALDDAVRVLGVDLLVDRLVRDFDVTAPEHLDAESFHRILGGNGVFVPMPLAQRLQLTVGDSLTLLARSRKVHLQVAGILRRKRFSSAWDRLVVVDVALAQELFGRLGRLSRIELLPRRGVDIETLAAALRERLPADHTVDEPSDRGAQTARMVRALQFNLTALSGISLLVGAVLIATTLATAVVQRRDQIALLRSLGASRRQILGSVLTEASMVGLLGGGTGVLGGVFGARAALGSVRATVAAVVAGVPASEIRVGPTLALLGIGCGIGIALVAAVLPALEATRTPPIQGLRGERPSRLSARRRLTAILLAVALGIVAAFLVRLPAFHDLPVAALLGALVLLAALLVLTSPAVDGLARVGGKPLGWLAGTPARLAAAALAAGRQRASWAAGAVGVAVALAVAIATMVDSFRTTVIDWTNQGLRADLWVRPSSAVTGVQVGRLDPEIVRIGIEQFGREAVDPFHTASATFRGEPVTLGAGEMGVVERYGGVPFRGGRPSRRVFAETLRRHGATVNEPFANRFGVAEGDTIHLQIRGGELHRVVTGVFYDYSNSQGMVVIDRGDFLKLYPDDGPRDMAIFLPPGTDASSVREKLLRSLGGRWSVEVLLNRQLRRDVLAVFDRTFAITTALQLVASTVAVVAVLTVLTALIGERRRELAVLRAVGASARQVASMVTFEAGLLGIAGAAAGLGFGLMVGMVLVKVVNVQSFGWTLRLLPPWGPILAALGFIVLACFVAGLAPARVATQIPPAEALYEE